LASVTATAGFERSRPSTSQDSGFTKDNGWQIVGAFVGDTEEQVIKASLEIGIKASTLFL